MATIAARSRSKVDEKSLALLHHDHHRVRLRRGEERGVYVRDHAGEGREGFLPHFLVGNDDPSPLKSMIRKPMSEVGILTNDL